MSDRCDISQTVKGTTVQGDLIQIGSADRVTIGASRPALPNSTSTDAPTSLIGLPRPPAKVFVGRADELDRLDAALESGARAAVYGLGGIGKSELALQYTDRRRDRYRLAWWIDSNTPAQIQAGLAVLARAIASGTHSVAAEQATLEEAAAWAMAWLASHPGWLLIFDNVEQVADIEPYLGRLHGGDVLITTRRDMGWQDICASIDLSVLPREPATGLLSGLAGSPPTDTTEAVASELGYLPLALVQAGAYIRQTPGMDTPKYLRLLRLSPNRILGAASARHDPERVITRVWKISSERIEALNPLAAQLLSVLSCFAADPLPLEVLYGADASDIDLGEALGLLASYSMITLADDTARVHRLVQAVTFAQLTSEQQDHTRQTAATLLESALLQDPYRIENWPVYGSLVAHAHSLLAQDSDGVRQIAHYLAARADYDGAKALQQQIISALIEVVGPDHLDTLVARHNLAAWIGEAGDAASARDQLIALLPIIETVLGPEHLNTLAVRHNLARWTGESGNGPAASAQFSSLVVVLESLFGTEHRRTLGARHELARWSARAKDAAAARDQFAALVPLQERVQGAEDPDTLASRNHLAYWTGRAGDPAAARDQLRALVPLADRVLGSDHPKTITARRQLARWTNEAGDSASARDQLAALVPIAVRALGPEHPDVLAMRHDLARRTGEAGKADSARDQLVALVPIAERVLGPRHTATLSMRNNLARWTGHAGDPAAARDQLAELLTDAGHALGRSHPNTLQIANNFASWKLAAEGVAIALPARLLPSSILTSLQTAIEATDDE